MDSNQANRLIELLERVERILSIVEGNKEVKPEIPELKDWSCRDCGNTDYWVNEVKKPGGNQGKHFMSCKKCKGFGGFTTEALSTR